MSRVIRKHVYLGICGLFEHISTVQPRINLRMGDIRRSSCGYPLKDFLDTVQCVNGGNRHEETVLRMCRVILADETHIQINGN